MVKALVTDHYMPGLPEIFPPLMGNISYPLREAERKSYVEGSSSPVSGTSHRLPALLQSHATDSKHSGWLTAAPWLTGASLRFVSETDFYKPVIADSHFLGCNRENPEFSMTWHRHVLFVNAAIEGRCQVQHFPINVRRGYNIADMTQLREIEQYGYPGEHALPTDTGHGFIWRLHDITGYEEREGGVYLEVEAIALTRDIPASLRWLVSPIVKHLSLDSLETMLRQTRGAGALAPRGVEAVGLCPKEPRGSSQAELVRDP